MLESYSSRDMQGVDILPAGLIASGGSVFTALFADRGLIFSDNSFYQARLIGDVVISQGAFDAIGMGGRIGLTAAELDLWNGDRVLDNMDRLGLATGRAARIKTVAAFQPWRSDAGGVLSSAVTVFAGVVSGLGPNGQHRRFAVSDSSWKLATPLQSARYAGTGGLNGSSDLTGKPKPVSLGWRFNVTPVYLGQVDLGDGAKETYQTHWRSIAGHDAVRERGVAMTKMPAAPGVGQWRDWPDQGVFQLGFTPNGAVTCDVRGDNLPYYAGTTVQIIQRLLSTLGPLLADTDFDLPSFGLADLQILGEVGWGQDADDVTAADAIDQLVAQAGIWLVGSRAGKMRVAVPQPLPGVENLSLDVGDIVSLKPVDMPASLSPAPNMVDITAARNWTPMTDIAGSVLAADRSALAGDARHILLSSTLIGGRQAQARTMAMGAMFRLDTDAQRRGRVLLTWLEKGLRAFEVTTDKYLGQVELGHVARVTYPLFGLDNGFTGVVAAWSEQVRGQRLTLTLVG